MGTVTVKQRVLVKNDRDADELRHTFRRGGIRSVNLIGSPGSGTTTLLEAVFRRFGSAVGAAVVEGDVKTDNDARRIAALGVPAVQIETGGACHLTAAQVRDALSGLPLETVKVLVIENVGNLICPVSFDLGEECRAIVISVAEGADKPLKYPSAFVSSDVLVITKSDLSPHVDVDPREMESNALSINPKLQCFVTSAKTGDGIEEFSRYLAGNGRKSR